MFENWQTAKRSSDGQLKVPSKPSKVPLIPLDSIEPVSRRNFYVGAVYAIWAVISIGLGVPALGYLFLPPKPKQEPDWTDIGDITRLSSGVPVEMVFRQNRVDGWKTINEKSSAWVVKQADRSILAFSPQCTHLGCAYHWDETQRNFVCPCHNSAFGPDGTVIVGPAPRPLDRYPTRVEGTRLYIEPVPIEGQDLG